MFEGVMFRACVVPPVAECVESVATRILNVLARLVADAGREEFQLKSVCLWMMCLKGGLYYENCGHN